MHSLEVEQDAGHSGRRGGAVVAAPLHVGAAEHEGTVTQPKREGAAAVVALPVSADVRPAHVAGAEPGVAQTGRRPWKDGHEVHEEDHNDGPQSTGGPRLGHGSGAGTHSGRRRLPSVGWECATVAAQASQTGGRVSATAHSLSVVIHELPS
jgi:hypothetical protein